MLRDRCPSVVSLALKYCKAKEEWLDHVYKSWIWIYQSKAERYEATKRLLGNKSNPFNFADTIDWENLDQKETKHWNKICDWVSWFQSNHLFIRKAYFSSKSKGYSIQDIKYELMLDYMLDKCPKATDDAATKKKKNKEVNELADFLINSFEQ